MALEDAVRFLVRASTDASLKARLDLSMTPPSVVALAEEYGFSVTERELAEALVAAVDELSDESLEGVSGGLGGVGAMDPTSIVLYVLRESYLENMEDLKSYAEKVKYYNSTKKAIREQLGGWPP